MKQFLRDYFTFNRRERNGVFILLSIIVLLIFCLAFGNIFHKSESIDFSDFQKQISEFESNLKSVDSTQEKYTISDNLTEKKVNYKEAERFVFNPNNLPAKDWKRLGLSDKQIKIIKNYESKGGKFYKKEDVKKIYGISEKLYISLDPYISIPKEIKTNQVFDKSPHKLPKKLVELNSADTSEYNSLKGIGAVFANRIIKYREKLGGFYKTEQLLEVYGFNQEKLDAIKNDIALDSLTIRKININKVTLNDLKTHPYIKYNLANAIVNYRDKHGAYKTIEDIKQIDLVNVELYTKLAPYLTLE